MTTYYTQNDHDAIAELLVGHRVTKVAEDTLTLDDGRQLRFEGNDGGCACSAGCYPLTELNGVDNVITKVVFDDNPTGDEYGDDAMWLGPGHYKIFVYADNQKINLATFTGSDGNGYYGTGYSITVLVPA